MPEVVEESEYTVKVRREGADPQDLTVKTKRCALCDLPREQMKGKRLALHLPTCPGRGGR